MDDFIGDNPLPVIECLINAMDWNALGYDKNDQLAGTSRKRTRVNANLCISVQVFRNAIKAMGEYKPVHILPTLRTFLHKNFYVTLEKNQNHELFDVLAVYVIQFKKLVRQMNKLYWDADYETLENVLVSDFFTLLADASGPIQTFHLSDNLKT